MKKNIKTKTKILISSFFVFLLALSMSSQNALSMSNEDCLECHGDEDLTREEDDSSIYVNAYSLTQSVHGEEECITCHQDADVEDRHTVLPAMELIISCRAVTRNQTPMSLTFQ
ncbi:MAG: cytochrome c3 family protein [Deltaproteobacteria bacterium]|nr:cytochrome c3 family protein [Deltaproteobacteria bacterium]